MTPVAQARPYGSDSLCAKQVLVLLIEIQQTPAKILEGVEFGLVQTESKVYPSPPQIWLRYEHMPHVYYRSQAARRPLASR